MIRGNTLLIGVIGLAGSGLVQAKDWSIVPNIGFQYRNLEFDQKFSNLNTAFPEGGLTVDLPTISTGLTFIWRKLYASLKYESSFEANADSDVPFTGYESFVGDVPALDRKVQTEVTRTDLSFTVGYNIWAGLNVFGGYLDGETELTPDPSLRIFDNGIAQNLAQIERDFANSEYRQKYTEEGWYLGVSYGWAILEAGTLSVSGAYALMDGTYEDNAVPDSNGQGTDFKYEGDSTGYSLAVSWSAPLTKHVGYYFDLRRQAYDFDGDDKSGNFPGSSVKTEEVMTSLTGGIQWYF